MKKSLSLLSCNTTRHTTKEYWRGLRHYGCHGILFRTMPILMSLMLCFTSFAQNGIFVDSTANVINTIIRHKPMGYTPVTYVKTSDSTGMFLSNWGLINSHTGKYNKIPISGYNVTDFTVVRDTIYMCGIKTGGRGFYAWMKLGPSPFSVQMKVYHLSDDTSFVTNPRRIQVFNNFLGTQVMLVGDYVKPNLLPTPAIVHIKNNNCYVAYRGGEYYDDIVVLKNYIVAVARKGRIAPNNSPQIMRVLPRTIINFSNTYFQRSFSCEPESANSRILLQHIDSNNFVAVYQDGQGYYINSHSVGSGGILNILRYSTVSTPVDNILDVSYNDTDSSLMVIRGRGSSSNASRFSCSSFPYISWIESYAPNVFGYCLGCMRLINSACRTSSTKFMVSGILDNHFMVWNTNSNCNIPLNADTISATSYMPYLTLPVTKDTLVISSQTLSRPIQSDTLYAVCQ